MSIIDGQRARWNWERDHPAENTKTQFANPSSHKTRTEKRFLEEFLAVALNIYIIHRATISTSFYCTTLDTTQHGNIKCEFTFFYP